MKMYVLTFLIPKSQARYRTELHVLGKHVRPDSGQVVPSLVDGWDTLYHIEDLKVWEQLDPTLWQEVQG